MCFLSPLSELCAKSWPLNHFDDAYEELVAAARAQGFAIFKSKSNNDGPEVPPSKYNPKGGYRRIEFSCTRGHQTKELVQDKKRNKKSTKTDCKFLCVLTFYKRQGEWRLSLKREDHNHRPDNDSDLMPALRR